MEKISDFKRAFEENREKICEIYYDIIQPKTESQAFYEACFCMMVPGGSYARTLKGLDVLKSAAFFHFRNIEDIREVVLDGVNGWELFRSHVRFPNQKFERLQKLADIWDEISKMILWSAYCEYEHARYVRFELRRKVEGYGYKAASHLLRNMGAQGLAIIDTHVKKYGDCWGIDQATSYESAEKLIRVWCRELGIPPHILDLLIWVHHAQEMEAVH